MKPKSTWHDGVLGQFLRDSTIHGVKYIGMKDKHISERILWIIAVLSCMAFSFYLVEEQYKKFYENPVIISFQPKETPISQIPFPAVTICNINILKKQIMEETLEKLETAINLGQDTREAKILSEHLSHYCLAASSFTRISNVTTTDEREKDFVQTIHKLAHQLGEHTSETELNEGTQELRAAIRKFKHRGMHSCDDMILKCLFARVPVDCKEVFSTVYTPHGSCCVFNMMPKFIMRNLGENDRHTKREKKYLTQETISAWENFDINTLIQTAEEAERAKFPKSQKSGGMPFGLSLLINPELESYGSCNSNDGYGFKIVTHSPVSFPNIADYGVLAPVNSEIFINVQPEATTANSYKLGGIPVVKRSCYFPSDSQAKLSTYKFYSSDNCMDECVARITYKICSCLRYFMPRNETQALCGATKLQCSEDVRRNLTNAGRKGSCSMCLPACTEIKYKMQVSQFPLKETVPPFQYNISQSDSNPIFESKNATEPSIVHIFIGTDSLYAKERKTLYDTSDLIANAGGLLGLTLGFSIISLVELLYFFTLRAWFQHKSDKEDEEDEDFYSRSTHVSRPNPRLSAIVRPRIAHSIQQNNNAKEFGYINWALKSTKGSIAKVDVSSIATPFAEAGSRRRGVPEFHLLSGYNEKMGYGNTYPYLS